MKEKQGSRLRIQGMVVITLLIVQYLLGTLSSLYVQFPENTTDWQHWKFAEGQLLVVAHIIVGMLLLLSTAVLFVKAARCKDRIWKIASSVSFGSVLLAIMSGSEYISTQAQFYSFAMATLFLVAIGFIAWGMYKSKP